MDIIKKAIEKSQSSQALLERREQRVTPLRRETPDTENLDTITYTQTRVVPVNQSHLESHRIVALDRDDPKRAPFDMLRTQVLQKMDEHGWQTLGVTSPSDNCGKTITAINLALSMAQQPDHTVMLVDFDLRNPTISKYLGLPRQKSLIDYLSGNATIAETLVNPGVSRLVVLPNQQPLPGSFEVVSSKAVRELVAEFKSRYKSRIIIFDLPPMLSKDDVMAFLPRIDCALLVVAVGTSTIAEVEECERHMQSTNYLGVVLNKAPAISKTYY